MFAAESTTLELFDKFKSANVNVDSKVLLGESHSNRVNTLVNGTPDPWPSSPPASGCVAKESFTVSFKSSNWLDPDSRLVVMLFILNLSLLITTISASV